MENYLLLVHNEALLDAFFRSHFGWIRLKLCYAEGLTVQEINRILKKNINMETDKHPINWFFVDPVPLDNSDSVSPEVLIRLKKESGKMK